MKNRNEPDLLDVIMPQLMNFKHRGWTRLLFDVM